MLEFKIIREIWSSVDATDTAIIMELDDSELVGTIEQQVEKKSSLTSDDLNTLHNYIALRIPLIRDLAYSKIATA